jgi:1,4-dihydroxy-2-naphthoate octaprenyltransferase
MVHFGNDYFDLAADRANVTPTAWSGGSRVLPAGELRPAVALGAAVAAAVAALASTVVLAVTIQPAPAVLALVLLAILVAWEYSAPPLRLHSRGLGEVVGALLVAGGTPLVGYGLQMHRLDWLPLLAVLPLCALQFGMLVVVSLPDVAGDAVVGKRTLAVRCGRPAAGRLAAGALALAYVSLLPLVALGLPAAAAWGYGVWLPVAGWHGRRLWHLGPRSDGPWDALGFWSILLVMGSALTVAIAVAILPRVS